MPSSDQGVSDHRYALIPRCLIFITRGQEVLLLRGTESKRIWPGRYNGIGGHIERGEDVLSAARRELQEEAGIQCPAIRLCGTITVDTGEERGIGIYVFTGECAPDRLLPSREGGLEWVHPSRLGELDLVEDLHVLLPIVLQMSPDQAPFSAHYHYDERDHLVVRFADS